MRQGGGAEGAIRKRVLSLPAIDLSRLRLQASELAGLLDQPAEFQKTLRALLDAHSHRLLRRGRSMAQRSALPAWDVPGILIRELEAALLPAAKEKGKAALATAAAIWKSGKLEEKRLASYLAGLSGDPKAVRAILPEWLSETGDPVVLKALAGNTCPLLWNADALVFRSDLRSWLEDYAPARRRFGWMALQAWVDGMTSEAVFAAIEFLPAVFGEKDPEAVGLASGLLVKLAEYSPQETQGWLAELPPKTIQQGRRFLRMTLPRLSAETADLLRGMLKRE
jgi:hypothetical protein